MNLEEKAKEYLDKKLAKHPNAINNEEKEIFIRMLSEFGQSLKETKQESEEVDLLDNWMGWITNRVFEVDKNASYKFWIRQAMQGYAIDYNKQLLSNKKSVSDEEIRNIQKRMNSIINLIDVDSGAAKRYLYHLMNNEVEQLNK